MSKKEKKKTVGAEVYEQLSKYQPGGQADVREIQEVMQEDYFNRIDQEVKKSLHRLDGDFYVVMITIHTKIFGKAIRQRPVCRQSCPSPQFDEAVFKYHRGTDSLEFLWVVPCKDACIHLSLNALIVAPEERDLRDFVLDFQDGTLLRKAKMLNGEKSDSPLLEKKQLQFKGIASTTID